MLEAEMRLLAIAVGKAEEALNRWRWPARLLLAGFVVALLLIEHRLGQIALDLNLIVGKLKN